MKKWVGVDVSKRRLDVYVRESGEARSFSQPEELKEAVSFIANRAGAHGINSSVVGRRLSNMRRFSCPLIAPGCSWRGSAQLTSEAQQADRKCGAVSLRWRHED